MNCKKSRIGVLVITYNAEKDIENCLKPVLACKEVDEVLVLNSSGTDNTVSIAKKLGAKVSIISRDSFNHGLSKEYARKMMDVDILVVMSPDAYGQPNFINKLVNAIEYDEVALAYSRQIPHDNADFFEAFPRLFNYPNQSEVRDVHTWIEKGPEAIFCSNSCAAYSMKALDQVGGFPSVLTGEDTIVAARFLANGYKIKYEAESIVKHSHKCSIISEFKRHFDAGISRNHMNKELLKYGKDEKKGAKYAKSFLMETINVQPLKIGYAILILLAKYLGYKIGSYSAPLSLPIKKKLSSQDFYWDSIYYEKK